MTETVETVEAVNESDLEKEGDLAADYLEGLLDILDLDGDLDLAVAGNRAVVSITGGGEDLDALASPRVVKALQDLTRLAVQNQTGEFSRLVLDIDGSRETHAKELRKTADAAIAALEAGREMIELSEMSSYERKIVHDYIAERGYVSESRGEGRSRRLYVTKAA